MTFDLRKEPWIPCRTRDGTVERLGLRAVLARAQDLDGICHRSPLVTLALTRLVLATLHRVYGPRTTKAWKALYEAGAFPEAPLDAYLEPLAARFDLFDAQAPFFQTRGLRAKFEPKGLGRLDLERSNYGAPANIFAHRPPGLPDAMEAGEAACQLVALQAFAPGGLVKLPGEPTSATAAPMNRGAYVLVRGRTFFETLVLNLVPYDPEQRKPLPGTGRPDLPAWERPPLATPTAEEPKRVPDGYVDWLTWQSRRVELVPGEDGRSVTGVVYCVGQGVSGEAPKDPMLAYRVDRTRGAVAIDLSDDRAVWRDCHALVRTTRADGAAPPAVVAWYASPTVQDAVGSRPVRLHVAGLRGDQAKLVIARAEELRIPDAILTNEDLGARLERASQHMEDGARALRYATQVVVRAALAPSGRDPDPADVTKITDATGVVRRYWSVLAADFDDLIVALPTAPDDAVAAFAQAIEKRAKDCLLAAAEGLGGQARHRKGVALGERSLHKQLAELREQGVNA